MFLLFMTIVSPVTENKGYWRMMLLAQINHIDDIFECIFLNENNLYFDSNFTEICSQGSNLQ